MPQFADDHGTLLDPLGELTLAIQSHTFGLLPTSAPIIEECFPVTEQDKQIVREKAGSGLVYAKAGLDFLEGGRGIVLLDQRGYTLESFTSTTQKTFPRTTYESLDALLIAVSPGYVEAMAREVTKRLEGQSAPPAAAQGAGVTQEEERAAEGGEGWK